MKNLVKMMAVLALCVLAFCGCEKKEGKTFTVGFDAGFPPYGFNDTKTGEYKGFDLDLAEEVCKRNGWTLVKKPIDWPSKDSELDAGTIDCIWNGFTINAERKDKYTWTEPYVRNFQQVLVKKDSGIAKLADLNGKVIVSQDGSSGASALNDFIKEQKEKDATFSIKELKLVPDYNTANTMLESGAADAIALDSAVAEGLAQKSNGKFVIMIENLVNEIYGVGFKKGNTELRDTVQKTLKEMVKDGTCANILKKWATEEKENGGAGIVFILTAE